MAKCVINGFKMLIQMYWLRNYNVSKIVCIFHLSVFDIVVCTSLLYGSLHLDSVENLTLVLVYNSSHSVNLTHSIIVSDECNSKNCFPAPKTVQTLVHTYKLFWPTAISTEEYYTLPKAKRQSLIFLDYYQSIVYYFAPTILQWLAENLSLANTKISLHLVGKRSRPRPHTKL